jgi:hypothetical protein
VPQTSTAFTGKADEGEDVPQTGTGIIGGVPQTGTGTGTGTIGGVPQTGTGTIGGVPQTGTGIVDADPAEIVAKALLCFSDKYVSWILVLSTHGRMHAVEPVEICRSIIMVPLPSVAFMRLFLTCMLILPIKFIVFFTFLY